MAYYAGLISAGDARQDVIAQLQGTDEARRTEVARWYQTELNWDEPVADLKVNPGVEYWAGMIDGGLSDDVVHAMILAVGIAPGQSATAYITGLYQAALGRDPDPTGLAYFAGQINQGISRYQVALGLLTTDEGRRHLDRSLLRVRAGSVRHRGRPQGRLGRRILGRPPQRLILTNTRTIAIVLCAGRGYDARPRSRRRRPLLREEPR